MEITRWLVHHGESLLETIGIIGGLLFTGIALHRDSRARRVENLFTITQHHREIWRMGAENPSLARVLIADRDVLNEPPSQQERLFVRSLILHLGTVYRAIKLDEMLQPQGMDDDIRAFFLKPVPKLVWSEEKLYQDHDFVIYVEKQIKGILN